MTDALAQQIEKIESEKKLIFNYGMKEQLAKDLRREIESVNGRFRNKSNGAAIDIENYLTQKLQTGIYVKTRPGVKEKYAPVFKIRDEDIKRANAKFTQQWLKAVLKHERISFSAKEYEEKAFELIGRDFLAVDDEEKGIVFQKITDTEIGTLHGRKYDINELLTNLGMARWADGELNEIEQAQHRASIKQKAEELASADKLDLAPNMRAGEKAKVKAKLIEAKIEKYIDLYTKIERRELRCGKTLPPLPKDQIESEFQKFFNLNTDDRSRAVSSARIASNSIDDLTPIQSQARSVVVKNDPTPHEF